MKIVRRTALDPNIHFPSQIHPVLQRVYRNRCANGAEIEPALSRLLSGTSLSGLEKACDILVEALDKQSSVIIIGDYDADGATSTALALRMLRSFGFLNIDFRVPDRFRYGYGLSSMLVDDISHADLLITVDNGISSIEGVRRAHEVGMKVIITDHHLPGDILPDAEAIVNPNQPGDVFPDKNLAGVGVIFYLMLALRARLRKMNWFNQQGLNEPNISQVLDLVALGTVADLVPLSFNNRILVNQGLKRIRSGNACEGIKALLNQAGKNPVNINSTDLGFAVAPRLNAAGRLTDMAIGINCLVTDDLQQARQYAVELDRMNQDRKRLENEMQQQALEILDEMYQQKSDPDAGICMYHSSWHQGIIGILASRIKQHWHRPVIVFADSDNHLLKGSARSIPGIHIRDVLEDMSRIAPNLISSFGGHSMAAGLSISQDKFDDFRTLFAKTVAERLTEEMTRQVIYTDGELVNSEINMQTAQTLRHAGPWGQSFPEPLFDNIFSIVETRVVGEKHMKMRLREAGSKKIIDAIAFYAIDKYPRNIIQPGNELQFAYKIDINEFAGKKNLQLIIEHLQGIAP